MENQVWGPLRASSSSPSGWLLPVGLFLPLPSPLPPSPPLSELLPLFTLMNESTWAAHLTVIAAE